MKDLIKLYPEIKKEKIRVIHNGVSEEYYPIPKLTEIKEFKFTSILKEKYIIYVGHRTSYKNFFVAAETIAKLDTSFKFLIIGEKLSNTEIKKLDKLISSRYKCLTGIDNRTLNIFYNYAFCLIYPSSYEGFGIPILEAMRAGCPVVTTDKSSIPEVAGDAAITVRNIDADSFADAIHKLIDNEIRMKIIAMGLVQSLKFSWNKSYEEVKKFYMELFDREK